MFNIISGGQRGGRAWCVCPLTKLRSPASCHPASSLILPSTTLSDSSDGLGALANATQRLAKHKIMFHLCFLTFPLFFGTTCAIQVCFGDLCMSCLYRWRCVNSQYWTSVVLLSFLTLTKGYEEGPAIFCPRLSDRAFAFTRKRKTVSCV